MELSDVTVARRRAEAMLQRIALRFRTHATREGVPEAVEQMESAMVTFAPRVEVGQIVFNDLPAEDQDFVEYWWGILFRRLCAEGEVPSVGATESGEEHPRGGDTSSHRRKGGARDELLDDEELNLAADELDLMRRMDEQESNKKRRMAEVEYQRYQDSQEKDTQQEADTWLREKEAAQHQAWEDWQVNEALTESCKAVVPDRFRLRLRGEISAGTGSSSSQQSMEWLLQPGDTLCLNLQVDRQCPQSHDAGVQSESRCVRNASTQKYDSGGVRPTSVSLSTNRAVNADDEEGEGLLTGSAGSSRGDVLLPSKGWRDLTAGSASVVIEDSQLP